MSRSVLIVDDDASFLDIASNLLRSRGFEVVGEASDEDAAIFAAERLRPDAVLLDVHLGDADALALAARLTNLAGRPRVLLTSSDPVALTPELARRHGATGFVAKSELAVADLVPYLVA